jgi:hypothetical protein
MARNKTTKLLRDMKKGTPTRNIPLGVGVEIPNLSGMADSRAFKKLTVETLSTSIPANRIPYSDGSNLTSSANFYYDGGKLVIDANSASEEVLTLTNSGAGNPRLAFETANTYIQDEGSQFTIRGGTIVNQFGTRLITESGAGTQELNITSGSVYVNAGTGTAAFRVDGAGGSLLQTAFATDDLYLNATNIGFHGATPVPRNPPIIDPVGGAVVDVESRAAIQQILAMLRTRGDILP